MRKKKTIGKGIYLVVDPAMNKAQLLTRLRKAVRQHIVAVQVWDHFSGVNNMEALLESIISTCKHADVPVLMNNRWELLRAMDFDGVHFDTIPKNIDFIRHSINREIITGITCNNDLSVVQWANDHDMDYISFCSLFPSTTANSCELVSFDTVRRARCTTGLPIFLAGGIQPGNMEKLEELDYTGIAVVSGIMNSDQPSTAIDLYQQKLNHQPK